MQSPFMRVQFIGHMGMDYLAHDFVNNHLTVVANAWRTEALRERDIRFFFYIADALSFPAAVVGTSGQGRSNPFLNVRYFSHTSTYPVEE
ncbi:MAG: hypothetical protein JO356_13965 [Acidobacteria bacterium]|nr:hypothetical protein [Acidobacteriota bacterium]